MMFDTARRRRPRWQSALFALVAAALCWLDYQHPSPGPVQHAAVFAFIVEALIWVGEALMAVGTYIAVSLEVFVQYIWEMVGWLARRTTDILSNTGAMFARVWESARRFYDDVLRPGLVWLHDFYERARSWLSRVLAPVLKWAKRVHDELQSLYKRFVRPVLDALDTTRRILDILTKLHVPFARQLDKWVTEAEQVITENYIRIVSYVNATIDVLNAFTTKDGMFQRLPFLLTAFRDAGYLSNIWWAAHIWRGATPGALDFHNAEIEAVAPATVRRELASYYRDGTGAYADGIKNAVTLWLETADARSSA